MIRNDSCECSKSSVDVTAVPPTMTVMHESQWVEHHPIASLNNTAPIEFIIPPQTEQWTDLSQSYLYLKFKIKKTDNSNLADDSELAPVNNFLHSMFSSIDLYMNNKLITSSLDTYPYRAYLENLMSYNNNSKQSHLAATDMWYLDTPGKLEKNVRADGNEGLVARRTCIAESKTAELCGRLHLDMFMQEKYIPNGVEIRLRLNRASPNFCLIGDGTTVGKIVIEKVSMNIRNVQLIPSVANDLNRTIAQHNMKFPINRVEVKTFTIGTGLRSKIEDHLFQGQLPKRLFIGMVKNEDMNGTLSTNPFRFQHFKLSKLEVSCDGHSIHTRPFEPNFEDGHCLRSYLSLYQAMGSLGQNQSFGLTLDAYQKGYTLWGYDLTPDQGAEEDVLHPIKTGNIRMELQFAEALADTINVVVYAEFDNLIEINHLREVITDF